MRILCLFLAGALLLSACAAAPAEQTAPPLTTEPAAEPTATQPPPPPTTAAVDPVAALLGQMTTEEKVGQLFLARCPREHAPEDIAAYHLGGYVLFAVDFQGQTPESIRQTLSTYQEASPIPLLLAVDEEGGSVCRVSADPAFRSAPFSSPRDLYAEGGMELVLANEAEKAYLLSSLGLNVNLGPVCDVTTQPRAFMYRRSLGEEPITTGAFAIQTMNLMDTFQVGTVLKHFPGYGNNSDTHIAAATDTRTIEELEARDLVPFSMAVLAGCDAIMFSHTVVTALDPDLPVSLSPAAHDYIRRVMGFEGVIVTDDLGMDAIRKIYGVEEAAVLAVLAGNDLLCSTDYAVQYPAVLEAVESGRIPMEQLDSAVERILRWKQSLGLIPEA